MIKKCEHLGCKKAGNCRCPKDRRLKDYWHFCQHHAAEYNKNWNYYAGMTDDEINKVWEQDTFGTNTKRDNTDYQKLISDFLHGRQAERRGVFTSNKIVSGEILSALTALGLSASDGWDKVQKKYRLIAKEVHPDTSKSKDQSRFIKINNAYQTLKKYFKKG